MDGQVLRQYVNFCRTPITPSKTAKLSAVKSLTSMESSLCPARWKRLKQFHRAGQRDDSIDVSDFTALNFAVFDGVIGVRQKFTYCRNTWPSMRFPYDFVRVEPVLTRPARPHTRNRRRRIH